MSLADYADRGALIGDLCGALKGARAPETEESGRYGLDRKTRRLVDRLARRLSGHLYFEHREQEDLADELFRAVNGYKRRLDESPRPKPKVLAAEFLDSLAQPPLNWQGFLGLRHLDLPSGTVVGQVRFLRADEEEGLAETFSRFGENAPRTVCTVSVVAGTDNIALERARRDAESALALVRQKVLHGFGAKMYPEQIAFSLTGHWAWKQDGRFDRSGWWLVDRRPIEMDLSGQPEWLNGLLEMSKRRESLDRESPGASGHGAGLARYFGSHRDLAHQVTGGLQRNGVAARPRGFRAEGWSSDGSERCGPRGSGRGLLRSPRDRLGLSLEKQADSRSANARRQRDGTRGSRRGPGAMGVPSLRGLPAARRATRIRERQQARLSS